MAIGVLRVDKPRTPGCFYIAIEDVQFLEMEERAFHVHIYGQRHEISEGAFNQLFRDWEEYKHFHAQEREGG